MMLKEKQKTATYIQDLKDWGLPSHYVEAFLSYGYAPQYRQVQFHIAAESCNEPNGPDRVLAGGTRGQAKSHAILAQVGMIDCQRTAELKFLYLRKIKKSAGEQFNDLIQKVFANVPHSFIPTTGTLTFSNGSRIMFGGFRSEGDIDGYIGIEYDGVIIEDCTTLSENKYRLIEGSVRTSKKGYRPRIYLSANPGGVGHSWVKTRFYDVWVKGQEEYTRFIHFTLGDNVFIDDGYRRYLDSLSGWLRKAWRDGDFAIAAGAYFTQFDPERHVISSISPSIEWDYWLAKDYGNKHWNVTMLFAKDTLGRTIILDEVANRMQKISTDVSAINAMLARYPFIREDMIKGRYAGHDIWANRADERRGQISVYDIYREQGITWQKANVDRINGAINIANMLDEGTLFIHENCQRLIIDLPLMQHDMDKGGEDVLKVDCDPESGEGGDDFYDCARYGLASRGGFSQMMNIGSISPYAFPQLSRKVTSDRFHNF